MRTINGVEIDDFTLAYITAALWSTTDQSDDSGGEPFDANYSPDDIAPDTLRKMAEECKDFLALEWQGKRVADWLETIDRPYRRRASDGEEYTTDELDGHDFWFTRNGHGVGFWDRGYGKIGNILTDAAHSYGSVDLYVGGDDMIHQQ